MAFLFFQKINFLCIVLAAKSKSFIAYNDWSYVTELVLSNILSAEAATKPV